MSYDLTNLFQSRTPGKSLPREFYVDRRIFDEELRRVFTRTGSSLDTPARSPSPEITSFSPSARNPC